MYPNESVNTHRWRYEATQHAFVSGLQDDVFRARFLNFVSYDLPDPRFVPRFLFSVQRGTDEARLGSGPFGTVAEPRLGPRYTKHLWIGTSHGGCVLSFVPSWPWAKFGLL